MLEYDLSCGKGAKGNAEVILDCVEQAEALWGRPLWQRKGGAYLALLEDTDDVSFAHRAREAFEAGDCISNLAFVHHVLSRREPSHQLVHWERALAALLRVSPDERGWHLFVTLLYEPLPDEEGAVTARRLEEQRCFERMPAFGSFADVRIVRACEDLPLPRDLRLAHACAWRAEDAPYDELREAAHVLAKYPASLERACELYRALLDRTKSPGLEVYYLANVLERRGLVDEAAAVYARYRADFQRCLSPMIHYAEFLERALSTAKKPPTLADVRAVAMQAEELGDGYYSGPGMVLARVALREGDERMARFAIERLLLLHELCGSGPMEKLRAEVTLPATRAFLDETMRFMAEATPGYCYSPSIRWGELEPLSPDEVDERWAARKVEILEASRRRG